MQKKESGQKIQIKNKPQPENTVNQGYTIFYISKVYVTFDTLGK